MDLKTKLIILTMLVNSLAFSERYNAELTVTGEDVVERIEDTICNSDELKDKNGEILYQAGEYRENENGEVPVDHGLDDGKAPIREALWLDNKGTAHNIGEIVSNTHTYKTQFGSILGIGGINNRLKKTDSLIAMNGNSNLYNDGLITMNGINQHIENILEIADLGFYRNYTEYTKNVINSNNSNIYNRGSITAKGDDTTYLTAVSVSLLKYNEVKQWKNVINMNNSTLNNDGEISYERDLNIKFTDGLAVGLLDLGLHYEREVAGVNATGNSVINNSGRIFVGGDILRHKNYSGITVDALGLDFEGNHTKYGIKSVGGKVTNSGVIEVERNFSYGKNANGDILRLELIYNNVLSLGLLSFKNYNEKSIGVSIDGGEFYNNGGTIKVGVNDKDKLLQIYENAGIAVLADNQSTVVFNEKGNEHSTVELEGSKVWLASLNNGSKMQLKGTTDIIFRTENKLGNEVGSPEIIVNTDIFGNDGSGTYVINGTVNVSGEKLTYGEIKDENGKVIGSEVVDKKKFNTDVVIGDTSNLDIGLDLKAKLDANGDIVRDNAGNIVYEEAEKLGLLNVNGKLDIKDQVDVDTQNFVGTDYNKFVGNTIIHADGGITGADKVKSNSFVFTLKTSTDQTNANIIVDSIKRKNFNDIVRNSELGNIFETSYDTANSEQLEVYRLLAQGEDQAGFDKAVDEVTGKDTLVTLPAQIYDITRDLNGQFKDFAINNNSDGLVFKYINSKSELGADSKTVGFDRKSSGIMVGYNNNISEKLRVGTGFAYMKSDIDYTSNSQNKVTTWNIRGYSDYDLGFAKIFNDLSFGYNQSENRRMADQVAYTGLKEGDLDIYTLSLNNSLYKDYKINDRFSLTPSLNLDFTYINQEDFKENGKLGASADKIDTYYITAGVGAKAKYNLLTYENSKIDLVGGINYAYDIYRDSEDMSLKVSAFNPYYKEELRELDKKSLDLNIGLDYSYKDKYSVGLNYTKELINDVENDQIGVDFTYKF